jgi:hypothetical protein
MLVNTKIVLIPTKFSVSDGSKPGQSHNLEEVLSQRSLLVTVGKRGVARVCGGG